MKRVWIYCRVASDNDRSVQDEFQMMMDTQKNELKDFADATDCFIIGITTEFCSGTQYQREGLEKIQSVANEGLIDTVLVKNIDRIGRNFLSTVQYVENLNSVGVNVLILDTFQRLMRC